MNDMCFVFTASAHAFEKGIGQAGSKGPVCSAQQSICRNQTDLFFHSTGKNSLFCPVEGARPGGQVIVLDIDNLHAAFYRPFDGGIDLFDDVPVMPGDVVLNVNHDQCLFAHFLLPHTP